MAAREAGEQTGQQEDRKEGNTKEQETTVDSDGHVHPTGH